MYVACALVCEQRSLVVGHLTGEHRLCDFQVCSGPSALRREELRGKSMQKTQSTLRLEFLSGCVIVCFHPALDLVLRSSSMSFCLLWQSGGLCYASPAQMNWSSC